MTDEPLWKKINDAALVILREMSIDDNSEPRFTTLSGEEHNHIVAALRQYDN